MISLPGEAKFYHIEALTNARVLPSYQLPAGSGVAQQVRSGFERGPCVRNLPGAGKILRQQFRLQKQFIAYAVVFGV